MAHRPVLAIAAAALGVAIAGVMLLGANWLGETVTPMLVHLSQLPYARTFGVLIPSMMGVATAMFAIFAARKKTIAPEERLRPRIRNGKID